MTERIELTVVLDRESPGSLASKLVQALRRAIEDGQLRPGDRVPPTRDFATRLGISRGTVVAAYEQLVAEGYFSAGQGRGTRVNERLAELHGQLLAQTSHVRNTAIAARPASSASADLEGLATRSSWRTAWRHAAGSGRLGSDIPAAGDPLLLHEIAEHLRTMRGTVRDPGDFLITAGAREGLGLLLTALGTTRGRQLIVGVEDGGPDTLRNVAIRHGAQTVALPADAEGLVTHALPHALLDAVIVTPSYQYPTGSLLPIERRQMLLAWARRTGVTVIEDDFDSELRFIRTSLPTLAALDDPLDGVVATLGSFSATLSIRLAAGFLVLPRTLRDIVLPIREDLGCPVSPVLQFALTELLAEGELRRQTARLRRRRARERMGGYTGQEGSTT